jgi:hypothetical protein
MTQRTLEMDRHWQGQFHCVTCNQYTGQPENHRGHFLTALPIASWGGKLSHTTFFIPIAEFTDAAQGAEVFKHGDITFVGRRMQ